MLCYKKQVFLKFKLLVEVLDIRGPSHDLYSLIFYICLKAQIKYSLCNMLYSEYFCFQFLQSPEVVEHFKFNYARLVMPRPQSPR